MTVDDLSNDVRFAAWASGPYYWIGEYLPFTRRAALRHRYPRLGGVIPALASGKRSM